MREILFRGKMVDNGEWLYGDLARSTSSFEGKEYNHVLIGTDWDYEEVIPETVGQFTGLTDKNGTKIFEGDIVNVKVGHESRLDVNYYVVFFDGAFCIKDNATGEKPLSFITMRDQCISNILQPDIEQFITVTGNIHDNPTT